MIKILIIIFILTKVDVYSEQAVQLKRETNQSKEEISKTEQKTLQNKRFSFPNFSAKAAIDYLETEPNGSLSEANALSLVSIIEGSLYNKSDIDFFKVETTEYTKRSISISTTPRTAYYEADLYVGVWSSDGTKLAGFVSNTNESRSVNLWLPEGTTYISIVNGQGLLDNFEGNLTYYLSIGPETTTNWVEIEPNNLFSSVLESETTMEGHLHTKDDLDSFVIDLPELDTITIEFWTSARTRYYESTINVTVVDQSGSVIGGFSSNSATRVSRRLNAGPGSIYINIQNEQGLLANYEDNLIYYLKVTTTAPLSDKPDFVALDAYSSSESAGWGEEKNFYPIAGDTVYYHFTYKNDSNVQVSDVLIEFIEDGQGQEVRWDISTDEENAIYYYRKAPYGERRIEFVLDPNDEVSEEDELNNSLSFLSTGVHPLSIVKSYFSEGVEGTDPIVSDIKANGVEIVYKLEIENNSSQSKNIEWVKYLNGVQSGTAFSFTMDAVDKGVLSAGYMPNEPGWNEIISHLRLVNDPAIPVLKDTLRFYVNPPIKLIAEARTGSRRTLSPLRTRAGRTVRFDLFSFTLPDSSDRVQVSDYTWRVPASLGSVVGLGELDLTTVSGVSETIVFESAGARAEFDIITTPHSIARVAIEPPMATVSVGGRQNFRATAYDRYDNIVLGKNFGWHTVGDIGTINSRTGDFIAASQPGEGYVIAVVNQVLVFSDSDAAVQGSGKVTVKSSAPIEFALYQNHPNPFNPETIIPFQLTEPGYITLSIVNLNGQEIRSLASGFHATGFHQVLWDGKDNDGRQMGSGVYIAVLSSGKLVKTSKLTIIR